MPPNWQKLKLGSLVSIKHGWPFKTEYISENLIGKPIMVSIGNFQYTGGFRFDTTLIREYTGPYPKEYELLPGDILLVMTCQTPGGEILGIPGRIPNDGKIYLHNQRLGKVVINSPNLVDGKFLYYLFLWSEFNKELCASATGTKILHTAPSRIEAFEFYLPSLSEQQAIVSILGALDDKIELNRRMNQTLEAMARALFQSWFVDFDLVRAKAEGRLPSGLDPATAALFPASFESSPIGEIPQGWKAKPLDQIAEFLNGLALQKFPPVGDDYLPVIKIAELRRGITDASDKASTLLDKKYIIEDGDILFSWSGSLEVVVWCGGKGALNQHLFKVTSKDYPKWFYYQWLKEFLPHFQQIAAGKATTMGHIQRHHLTAALAIVPPGEVLKRLTHQMEPILEKVVLNNLEVRTLTTLRDELLPRLLSGELRVKEAEKELMAVSL